MQVLYIKQLKVHVSLRGTAYGGALLLSGYDIKSERR